MNLIFERNRLHILATQAANRGDEQLAVPDLLHEEQARTRGRACHHRQQPVAGAGARDQLAVDPVVCRLLRILRAGDHPHQRLAQDTFGDEFRGCDFVDHAAEAADDEDRALVAARERRASRGSRG